MSEQKLVGLEPAIQDPGSEQLGPEQLGPEPTKHKIWVKRYFKQKEGFYRDRFPYIYLKQMLDELERRPQDYYLREDEWFAFCRETKVEGISWLRQLIASRPTLFAQIHPHLKSNLEQRISERVGLLNKSVSDERVRSMRNVLRPPSSLNLSRQVEESGITVS